MLTRSHIIDETLFKVFKAFFITPRMELVELASFCRFCSLNFKKFVDQRKRHHRRVVWLIFMRVPASMVLNFWPIDFNKVPQGDIFFTS